MKMKDSMDRMEFDQGNLQEEAPRRVQRRKRPELKPIWFAAVAVVLLAVVLIAALTDTTAFDGLRRSVTYARAKKDETGCAQLYHYAADRTSCFASLDGSLAIVTNSQLLVMQEDGQVVCNETVKWTSCTVTGTGSLAAAYDIGGSDVYVLNAQGLVRKITCGGEILSVTLTREGRLAVTLNERGYKAAVEVIQESRDDMDKVVAYLMEKETITGAEMVAIIEGRDPALVENPYASTRQDGFRPSTPDVIEPAAKKVHMISQKIEAPELPEDQPAQADAPAEQPSASDAPAESAPAENKSDAPQN